MSVSAQRVYGEPGTLYARCGGVFGVAAFADRCMDRWMADQQLNDNALVSRWHKSAQRPGFKFLVVQIICNLTGGPQVYTGRPMDQAHKHLNISIAEWEKFMEIFNDVCAEFSLSSEDTDDLNALLISMMDECVVWEGEQPARDPGPARPSGNNLYARSGGVYPLALFVDRWVDALLHDERVAIPVDGQKRNEASLKYLTTEIVCRSAGGPEVITSHEAEETLLLVPKAAWPIAVLTSKIAADHLPEGPRDALIKLLETDKVKALLLDPNSKDGPLPGGAMARRAAVVKSKEKAAAGNKLLSRAVINARHAGMGASVAARKRVYGDPRTLYGKGGGVFGLAKLSHVLMEAWMADATLNSNEKVARWHEGSQKAGFKFLVTQILGYQTGGPQKYTGRAMDEAHKHLAITPEQWRVFTDVAVETFEKARVPVAARRTLLDILSGFQKDCVLSPGEPAPPDPGAPRPHPSSMGTSYHRLGGVYPIAHFASYLIEVLLKPGSAVQLNVEPLDSPEAHRHEPGLKYMLTELLCHATGGPEVVTASGFDEAKLGVLPEQWPIFLAHATDAAARVFPTPHHRAMILSVLSEHQAELCFGMDAAAADAEGEALPASPASRAKGRIIAAGFEEFDAVAALAQTDGDADKALQMLVNGWQPTGAAATAAEAEVQRSKKARMDAATAAAADDGPKCPFGYGGGQPPPGHPRVPGMGQAPAQALPPGLVETVKMMAERGGLTAEAIATSMKLDLAAVKATLAPPPPAEPGVVQPLAEPMASAAKTMAERGLSPEDIAKMLSVDVDAVKATVHAGAGQDAGNGEHHAGKLVGNPLQIRLDELLLEDEALCCPVLLVLFIDPVTAADGFSYERTAAEGLTNAAGKFVSPMTREELPPAFVAAEELCDKAKAFRLERGAQLLAFAAEVAPVQPGMAVDCMERISEYLSALPPAEVSVLSADTIKACDKLLLLAHSADNPEGTWHAKPADLRRVNALKLQATAGGGADLRQLTCLVCFDDYPALKGIECSAGAAAAAAAAPPAEKHFMCYECLDGHVTASVDNDSIDAFVRKGGVVCVDPSCAAPPFADGALAKALCEETFAKYSKAKEKVAEQRINAELEKGFEQRLKVEREKAGGDQARANVKAHICEKILTLSCPRCGQAFIDFNGCWALYCGRAGCGCGFCAICQEDCQGPEVQISGGDPAHRHVASCPLLKRIGMADKVHQGGEAWETASRKAKMVRLMEYLATLTEAQKQHALEDCANELRDLKINPAKLGKAEDATKGGGGGGDGRGAAFAAAFAAAVGRGMDGARELAGLLDDGVAPMDVDAPVDDFGGFGARGVIHRGGRRGRR